MLWTELEEVLLVGMVATSLLVWELKVESHWVFFQPFWGLVSNASGDLEWDLGLFCWISALEWAVEQLFHQIVPQFRDDCGNLHEGGNG